MPDYDEIDRRDDGFDDRGRDDDRVIRRAKELVKGPAIGLLITGIVAALAVLLGVVQLAAGMPQAQIADTRKKLETDEKMPQAQKDQTKQILDMYESVLPAFWPLYAIAAVSAFVTILGAVRMMSLQARGLTFIGAIWSMLPLVSGCCCLGIPLGIWVIMTLNKAEVKAGYAAVARESAGGLD